MFRIFQEILTNTLRAPFARASRVEVRLPIARTDFLHMEVSDNGRGIGDAQKAERQIPWFARHAGNALHILGGEVAIQGREGKGTTVKVKVPLPTFGEQTRPVGRGPRPDETKKLSRR